MENNNELQTVINEYLLIYHQSSNSQVLQIVDLQKLQIMKPSEKNTVVKKQGERDKCEERRE